MYRLLSAVVSAAILAVCTAEGEMSLSTPVYDPNAFQVQPVYSPESGMAYNQAGQMAGSPQPQGYVPLGFNVPDSYQNYQGGYDHGYGQQSGYEGYLSSASAVDNQLAVPSALGLWPLSFLGGVVSSSIVAFIGKALLVIAAGFGVLLVGALGVLGVCSLTPVCTISYHGLTPHLLKEEVRSLITPDNISRASKFVREAVDKYQRMQKAAANTRR